MTATALAVRPLDALARRINARHENVECAAKSMLFHAREAGEALLIGRKLNPSNQAFGQWCRENGFGGIPAETRSSAIWLYENAGTVLERLQDASINHPVSIRQAYREALRVPSSNLPTFTQDDAEYALKIAARLDSEFEGEREVARSKLEKLAEGFGITGDGLVEKARAMRPAEHLTSAEKALAALDISNSNAGCGWL